MDSGKLQKTIEFYYFTGFRLDVRKKHLWHGETFISLTPKEFGVLLYLVERSGIVAEKNDLLDAVWTDTYVEEATLARNISWLRKKLATGADGEKLIETVPKRGYLFAAEVTRSANNGKAMIVEEQTIEHFRFEETITLNDAEMQNLENAENKLDILPNPPVSPHPRISLSLLTASLAFIALAGIGFIIYQNYLADHALKPIVASRVVPFSGAVGHENTPAFSPDGKQLAYSWNGGEDGTNDIYVRLVGTGEPLHLTDTKANEQYPTFSPDGSHIAFIRGDITTSGEVILIPTLGGAERRITQLFSGNYSISYSPDSQNIAVIDTENSTADGQFAVYLVNTQTGDRRRVTSPAEFSGETTPRFSPDGKSLAFVRIAENEKQDLYVVPASGGEPSQITFDGTIIHSLAWSADGREIYFVSYRNTNQLKIWHVPAAGGKPEIISTGGSDITNIAVSPDGKTLVFTENKFPKSIWRVMADGQKADRLINSTVNEDAPQFSSDGTRIVFLSDRTGDFQIWTVDAAGKNLRQITDSPLEISPPQFSPDDSRIAFSQREAKDVGIYVVSAEGGAARRITPKGMQGHFPMWSAEGGWIYFISNQTGEDQVWKIAADGSGKTIQITKSVAILVTPAPDDKTVFFVKSNNAKELWRIPSDGGAEEIVPEISAGGFLGRWSMGKAGIYFLTRNTDGSYKVKYYDFATRQIKEVLESYKIPSTITACPVTADGNVFLYTSQILSSRLMLAELP